ncbi:MAG: hypothetical protein PVH61_24560 [Candidatus Aminicenantes bacterium]|jgi:hypothetical protein
MEIHKQDIKAQESLSRVNVDFLDYVEKHPDTLKRSSFKLLELNDWLFTLQPWPTFISQETRKNFQEAGVKLFNLIKQIPYRVFNNDPIKISQYFNIPTAAVELQLAGTTHEHLDYLLGRGDFIISPTGLKCLEYNVSANLGGIVLPIWENLYLNTPLIHQFLKENHIKINNENLISLILEHSINLPIKKMPDDEEQKEINIAIIRNNINENEGKTRNELYLNELYKKILPTVKTKARLKGKVFLCDFSELILVDGYVFYKGKKLHVLIEMSHGVIPPKIIESFKSRKIYIINGPISNLLSNKLTLAVLSERVNSDVFTAEDKAIIHKYIPWTRKIRPGSTDYKNDRIDHLEHFIRSHRDKLVIKPSRGLGGEGICVGMKSSREEWEIAVNKAIKEKDWLVQEYVSSSPGLYQSGEQGYDYHDMVWGFFVCGSRYFGAWNRVMPKKNNRGVINCHQGATVSIIFEVEN